MRTIFLRTTIWALEKHILQGKSWRLLAKAVLSRALGKAGKGACYRHKQNEQRHSEPSKLKEVKG